jgi:hypothetical protein
MEVPINILYDDCPNTTRSVSLPLRGAAKFVFLSSVRRHQRKVRKHFSVRPQLKVALELGKVSVAGNVADLDRVIAVKSGLYDTGMDYHRRFGLIGCLAGNRV